MKLQVDPEKFEEFKKEWGSYLLMGITPEEIIAQYDIGEILKRLDPKEILKSFKPEEILAGLKPEEIEAYLKKIKMH